ncbi:hypothetical protein [Saccharopolyspora spinosa]|uniref:hypothetical protein n=1 Tax=Saccharopolyspora spinosa TaxID=60894 RepID=UPI00130519C0|nr:hypothetical protein [Saccharopolyspora spinosa]
MNTARRRLSLVGSFDPEGVWREHTKGHRAGIELPFGAAQHQENSAVNDQISTLDTEGFAMPAVMQDSAILDTDPDELITRHRAMELLGVTRPPAWRRLVRDGEIAIFQPAAGPKPAYVVPRRAAER